MNSNGIPVTGQGYTKLLDSVMSQEHLSLAARVVLCRLLRYKRVPTAKRIAANCYLTYNVTRKALAELTAAGLIERVGYGAYSVVLDDNSVVLCANPTRETVERQGKTRTVAPCATEDEDMNLNNFGASPDSVADDLPEAPKRRRVIPVDKWSSRRLAVYFKGECLTRYFGKATVNEARLSGFIKSRMGQGISPVDIKAAIDAFLDNPRWVSESSDFTTLLVRNLDDLVAQVQRVQAPAGNTYDDYFGQ